MSGRGVVGYIGSWQCLDGPRADDEENIMNPEVEHRRLKNSDHERV